MNDCNSSRKGNMDYILKLLFAFVQDHAKMTSVVQETWANCLLCNPLSKRNERDFPGEDDNRKKA